MASLKEQKEAFVTGHEGTTPWEILLIISTTPIGLLFYQAMTRIRPCQDWQLIVWEALSFGVPMILCQSSLIHPWGVCYLVVQLVVGIASRQKSSLSGADLTATHTVSDAHRASLTVHRSSLMFLTFIAILAVDFHVFPRRFVKTETHGYSLMDVGAASFVFAAGVVSARSRGRVQNWTKMMLRMLPLLVMGLIRLLTHKGLDYQEHVSEYGVHWNFFFTLAMLSPTACLFPGPGFILPLVLLSGYQAALSLGLQDWVVDAPRQCRHPSLLCDFVFANREGVLGCIGYGALYLASEWIGAALLWRPRTQKSLKLRLAGVLGGSWMVLATLLQIPVSRRTTNAPFIVWILLINVLQLLAVQWAAQSQCRVPLLFDAVNAHGLIMFVIANLMTGLTNLSINTLQVTDGWALGILFVYIYAVGGIAYALQYMLRAIKRPPPSEKKIN